MIMVELTFYSKIAETSNCEDKEESLQAGLLEDKWLISKIFYSYEACAEENRQKEGGKTKVSNSFDKSNIVIKFIWYLLKTYY